MGDTITWPADYDTLSDMIDRKRMSAREIGRVFSVSRNAVIGRAYRLDIQWGLSSYEKSRNSRISRRAYFLRLRRAKCLI